LPAVRGHELADARSAVLGQMPRFLIASLDAFRAGDFPSSKALARMQVRTGGRLLRLRRARSTAIGPGVDAIFLLGIALWGVLPQKLLAAVFASSYVSEVGVEILLTPATWPASPSRNRRRPSAPGMPAPNLTVSACPPTALAGGVQSRRCSRFDRRLPA